VNEERCHSPQLQPRNNSANKFAKVRGIRGRGTNTLSPVRGFV
jgi:hypothetical protein